MASGWKILRFARWAGLAAVLATAATPAAAVITLSSGGYNIFIDLKVVTVPLFGLGPVGAIGGTAGGPGALSAYNLTGAAGAVNSNQSRLIRLRTNTGTLGTTAASPFPTTPTATATASTADLALRLQAGLGAQSANLLTIGATEIRSAASVEGVGRPSATGSAMLSGLTIGGSLLLGNTFNASLFVNPAANTVLFDLVGIKITLNEQILTGDGSAGAAGITVNSLHAQVKNVLTVAGLVSGDIIISQSRASYFNDNPSFVPEPAVWLQLIIGFGAVGAITRRQRAMTAAA